MPLKPLKILVAPNGFKESMSATEAARAISLGLRQASGKIEVVEAPLADGGSGTVEAIIRAAGGEIYRARVENPRGAPVMACYGMLADRRTAVIEMAAGS